MKKALCILFTVIVLSSCSSNQSIENVTIAGKINNNSEYNGGANPPQELLDALAIYNPSANQLFYVRNAINYAPFTAAITSFSTDVNGNYSLNLPVGTYAIVCKDKYEFEQNQLATADCIYLQQPDGILTVVSAPQVYDWSYTAKANVCVPHP
jgi:hypothetical protein